jgi:hypothetical protein
MLPKIQATKEMLKMVYSFNSFCRFKEVVEASKGRKATDKNNHKGKLSLSST